MRNLVSLRPLTVDDAEAMSTVLADPELFEFIGGQPPSTEDLRRRYAAQIRGPEDDLEQWINMIVTLQPSGQPIGYVQATVQTRSCSAEVAWVIGRRWQGFGYAQQAGALLVDQLVDLGVRRLYAHIHPGHHASEAVARKLGMTRTEVIVDGELRWERRGSGFPEH